MIKTTQNISEYAGLTRMLTPLLVSFRIRILSFLRKTARTGRLTAQSVQARRTGSVGLTGFCLLFALSLMLGAEPTAASLSAVAEPGKPYLRVEKPAAFIRIPDRNLTFRVGQRLPLFQKNQHYYIAIVSTGDKGHELCAFPRVGRKGRGTAWVTDEKDLIFGLRTSSCKGRFFFRLDEELRVFGESESDYRVEVARHDRQVLVRIPKSVKGIVLAKRASAPQAGVVPAQTPTREKPRVRFIGVPSMSEQSVDLALRQEGTDATAVAQPERRSVVEFLSRNRLRFEILLIVAAIGGLLIILLLWRSAQREKKAVQCEFFSTVSDTRSDSFLNDALGDHVIRGELNGFSMEQLIQFPPLGPRNWNPFDQ